MSLIKKVAAVVFAVAMVVTLVPSVHAATASELQAQINALLAQIQSLQSQLGTTGGTTVGSSYSFTRDLTVGSKGADVSALQQVLINGGFLKISAPTDYFGPLTKAALAAFQSANGISPAAGYFGPKTRAFVATMSTGTGTGTGTGTTTPPVSGGLNVSLALDNPAAGNVALGAVAVPMMALNFSAGSQPVTVNSLTIQRSGLSQDSDLQNVYLYNGANRVATNMSISNGQIVFSNASGLFTVNAGQTQEIVVKADLYGGASSASHIVALSIPAASNVVTAGGVTVGGNFPINGNQMSLVSVSNLATLNFQSVTSTSAVNAGQTNNLVGQFTLTASNNPVKVTSLRFTMTGSEPTQYIQNLKLMNGSTQVGATLSSLNGNVAQFDLSNAPLMLTSGQSATLSLYADVTGGVGYYFQFTVQQSSDIQAVDNMYNVGIGATTNYASPASFPAQNLNYVNVQPGGLVINSASSTALYVVQNNSNSVLGQFTVLASGDNIRLQTLTLTMAGDATTTNVQVLINGSQLGTTQTTMGTAGTVTFSNLNYIVPANTTQTLTVQGTVSAGNSVGATVSITGQSQSNYTTVGPVNQSSPVLQVLANTSNLTAYQNGSFGTPVLMAGTTAGIASFVLQAGQVNSALLGGVNISIPTNVPAGWLSNLSVNVNGTQMGVAQGNVTAGGSYTFTASSPLVIAANSSVTVDVYASISNAAATTSLELAKLSSVNATAGNNSVNITAVDGQSVTISQGNTLASVTLDSSSPAATVMGMGTNSNTLAIYRLNGSTSGPVTVTQLTIQDGVSSTNTTTNATTSAFNNFTMVNNGVVLNAQPSLDTNGKATFVFGTPITIAQNQYATVSLVGNAATYNSAPGAEASQHSFQVVSYVANLTTGATTTNVLNSANGNNITLYRTMLSGFSAGTVSPVTSAAGVGTILSAFNVGAATGNDVYLQKLVASQSGSVVDASTTIVLSLIDSSNPSVSLGTLTLNGTATSAVELNGASTPYTGTEGWDIPANSTRTLQFKVVSSTGTVSATNNNGTYQVSISGVTWGDGSTGTLTVLPTNVTLPIAGPVLTNLSN